MTFADLAAAAPPTRIDKYEIIDRIGAGGMATVYRARLRADLEGGASSAVKQVALKVIRPRLSQDRGFILMFLEEVRLAMELGHRNIVQTFDAGRHAEQHYYVMELVSGCSLRQLLSELCRDAAPLPLELALFIGIEVCAALAYAHTFRAEQGGVIHRDVSPSNVLLSSQGEVKLADFGVAKAARGLSVTSEALIKGKLSYMAPEQARGVVEPRSDLFALGAVLYELVCGTPIRAKASLDDVRAGRIAVAPPHEARPEISPSLSAVLLGCLASEVDQRPPSAAELRQRLGEEMFQLQVQGDAGRDLHGALREFLAQRPALLPDPPPSPAAAPDPRAAALARAVMQHALEVPTDHGEGLTAAEAALDDQPTLAFGGRRETEVLAEGTASLPAGPSVSAEIEPADPPTDPHRPPARARWPWLVALALLAGSGLLFAGLLWTPERGGAPPPDAAALAAAGGDAAESVAPANDAPPASGIDAAPAPPPDGARSDGTADAARRAAARRAPRRRRPTRPPKGTGLLDINAVPWAKVYVDGRYRGETPVQRIRLGAGLHRVKLVNPRYKLTRTVRVRVRAGQRLRRVIHLQ